MIPKFRVWDGQKMHYPEIVHLDSKSISFSPTNLGGGLVTYPLAKVMQFTGLKDANCKEIYEGDKIRVSETLGSDIGIFEVYWGNNYPAFEIQDKTNRKLLSEDSNNLQLAVCEYFTEVIGNIHSEEDI